MASELLGRRGELFVDLGLEGVERLRALDLGHSANSVAAPALTPGQHARAGTIRVLDLATRRDLLWAVVPDVSLVPNVERHISGILRSRPMACRYCTTGP
jgi:hypothetical protein